LVLSLFNNLNKIIFKETPDRRRVRSSLRSNNKNSRTHSIPEVSFPSSISTHLSFASTSSVIANDNSPPTCRLVFLEIFLKNYLAIDPSLPYFNSYKLNRKGYPNVGKKIKKKQSRHSAIPVSKT